MNDDALKAAYQHHHSGAGGDHVGDEAWERFLGSELDAAEHARVVAHLLSCAECSTVHRRLIELAAGARQFDPEAVGTPLTPPRQVRPWMYVSALATAAAIVLAAVLDRPSRVQPADVERSGSDTAVSVVIPADGQVLVARRLAWQAVPGAEAYEVRINTSDGGIVWSTRASSPEVEIPATMTLPVGTYYWRVNALRDGAVLGSSPLVTFRIE